MEDKKTFVVYVTETLQRKVLITAKNKEEAIKTAVDSYYDEEIVLDSSDYLGVEFEAKETENSIKIKKTIDF